MFVSAIRHYFEDIKVFDNARPGDCFDIDSGLGGSCRIRFNKRTAAGYEFSQPAHFDYPSLVLTIIPAEVLSKVFICVPDNQTFREWKTVTTLLNGKRYAIDKDYGIVWVEDPTGYFELFSIRWRDADPRETMAVRKETQIYRKKI